MSIAPTWCDFKTYGEGIGPGRGRLARLGQCVFSDGERVWFSGWRRVLITLLVGGQAHRPDDWVLLQRVRCGRRECGRSWTLRPAWMYPHRSLEPDVAETAALAYLREPHATYAAVATAVGCAWITVWLLGRLDRRPRGAAGSAGPGGAARPRWDRSRGATSRGAVRAARSSVRGRRCRWGFNVRVWQIDRHRGDGCPPDDGVPRLPPQGAVHRSPPGAA